MTLLVRETYINETTHTQFGKSDWEDTGRPASERGAVYRTSRAEYGKCISKMYRDKKDGGVEEVGWVFQKRMRYEDARRSIDTGRYEDRDYYIRGVWVEVRDTPLCARCGKDEDAHHTFMVREHREECAPHCGGPA